MLNRNLSTVDKMSHCVRSNVKQKGTWKSWVVYRIYLTFNLRMCITEFPTQFNIWLFWPFHLLKVHLEYLQFRFPDTFPDSPEAISHYSIQLVQAGNSIFFLKRQCPLSCSFDGSLFVLNDMLCGLAYSLAMLSISLSPDRDGLMRIMSSAYAKQPA